MLMKADAGECSVHVLLGLSTTFYMVDLSIIIERVRTWVGISTTALQWFPHTFLTEKRIVTVDGFTCSQALFMYGMQQGSILGPIVFSLYLLPMGHIIKTV